MLACPIGREPWRNSQLLFTAVDCAAIQVLQAHTVAQMDKTWSAQASRPYDPYLTPKGEEQVLSISSFNLAVLMSGHTSSTSAKMLWARVGLAWHLV